ncbi:MAG TPA: AMP-binding protein [Acidimicrobiales bacterium]|nr:AMP-binding protein [Acidimicrobiales bacterium]
MNLALLLEMAAGSAADRIVVGSRVGGLTASELHLRAQRSATAFVEKRTAHVGFLDLNSEAVPIALFGAALAGLPFAPINYRLTDVKLSSILERLVPGVVVVGPDAVDRVRGIDGLEVMTTAELLALAADHAAAISDELPFVDPDDVAVLLFTSGTTGDPKAAVLRHRHLASYVITTLDFMSADETDAQLVSVPIYHIAGVSAILSSLYSGRRIVYLPAFDAAEWVRVIRDEQITQAMVVPTMLGRVLSVVEADGNGLPSLRHLSYGGGRMPVELIERAMTALPDVSFVNAYGLTETSSTIAVLTPDDHREAIASDDPAVRGRLGSVGQPLPTIELEIRGADGEPLGSGERGEIYVRGDQVAGEYLGRSLLTDDGWFPTNDAGHLDAHGFLFLDGRLDDVIVRGAENLSPGEIEDVLLSNPGVAEVAVVGVPDEEWGEAVAAAVVLEPGAAITEDELKEWVRDRLRSTKTPAVIDFRTELPYNETGKLLRRVLRDELGQR